MPMLRPLATPGSHLPSCLAACLIAAAGPAWAIAPLPDPDGTPADMTKPVQVFILMGQSNMLGFGKIAGTDKDGTLEHAAKTAGLYPYLVDDAGLATRYEQNLVHLIKALRKDFNAPNAPFVLATLGQTKKGDGGNDGTILDAMLAVDGESGKHPEFKGNVATVYTHPLPRGGASNGHYGGNAQTYMNVGEAMGEAMLKLINAGIQSGGR